MAKKMIPLSMMVLLLSGVGIAGAALIIFVRVEAPSTAYVTLSGTFEVTPASFVFGNVAPGSSVTQTVTVRNVANKALRLDVWSTLSGNPNLSLSVKNGDGSPYAGVTLSQGESVSLTLVLSSPVNAQSGEVKFTVGLDGVAEG